MNLVSHPDVFHCCIELSNLMNMGSTASNPCTVDEISSKTRKNQLEFIWKIFASRSQLNKSHSIRISILWDSIENMFFTIKIKKLVSCSFKELRKVCQNWFFQESLSKAILEKFCMFHSLWQVCLKMKSSLESKFLKLVSILTLLSHLFKLSL